MHTTTKKKKKTSSGKPKWQVLRDYADAQRKIQSLELEVNALKHRDLPADQPVAQEAAAPPPPSGGCGCVLM